jgi:hypothetical protein
MISFFIATWQVDSTKPQGLSTDIQGKDPSVGFRPSAWKKLTKMTEQKEATNNLKKKQKHPGLAHTSPAVLNLPCFFTRSFKPGPMAYDLWIDYTSGADPKQAVG